MRRVLGWLLVSSPFTAVLVAGLIFDTRDAAIGIGSVLGLIALMGAGFYLLEDRS